MDNIVPLEARATLYHGAVLVHDSSIRPVSPMFLRVFNKIFLELHHPCLFLPPSNRPPTPSPPSPHFPRQFFPLGGHRQYPCSGFGGMLSASLAATRRLLLHLELEKYHAICDTKLTNDHLLCPDRREGGSKRFIRSSVSPSVCLSVRRVHSK